MNICAEEDGPRVAKRVPVRLIRVKIPACPCKLRRDKSGAPSGGDAWEVDCEERAGHPPRVAQVESSNGGGERGGNSESKSPPCPCKLRRDKSGAPSGG